MPQSSVFSAQNPDQKPKKSGDVQSERGGKVEILRVTGAEKQMMRIKKG
jgi:hypothetical protein